MKGCNKCKRELPESHFLRKNRAFATCNDCSAINSLQWPNRPRVAPETYNDLKKCSQCGAEHPEHQFIRYGLIRKTCNECAEKRKLNRRLRTYACDENTAMKKCSDCHTIQPEPLFHRNGHNRKTCDLCAEKKRIATAERAGKPIAPTAMKRCVSCRIVQPVDSFEHNGKIWGSCTDCLEKHPPAAVFQWLDKTKKFCAGCRVYVSLHEFERKNRVFATCNSCCENRSKKRRTRAATAVSQPLPQARQGPFNVPTTPSSPRPTEIEDSKRRYHVSTTRFPFALAAAKRIQPPMPLLYKRGLTRSPLSCLPYGTASSSNILHGLTSYLISACRKIRFL